MTQTERIAAMEAALDRVLEAARQLQQARARFEAAGQDYEALSAYYGSAEWRQDYADDEAGRLPAGLKRGVLSEDGAWNALEEYRALRETPEE